MKLIAYPVGRHQRSPLVPGPALWPWTPKKARQCLPITLANAFGWDILCPTLAIFRWSGSEPPNSTESQISDSAYVRDITNHFGYGIVTFSIPYLFRWEGEGVPPLLHVRGPANLWIQGAHPLEGLVDLSSHMTFTMNWQITTLHQNIIFPEGAPICRISPLSLEIPQALEIRPLYSNPALKEEYQKWSLSRDRFNVLVRAGLEKGWQADYVRTVSLTSIKFPEPTCNPAPPTTAKDT